MITPREKQVLEMIQRGMCNKEIAQGLGISLRTAKFHVSNLLAKAGVDSRLRLATQFKLVPVEDYRGSVGLVR